ncbi:hypothetical protein [Myxococcus sp. NMCA1]|nr:hypothetical protein [Myxococcus sp. NMCA1]WAM25083.1 hypothetical protein OZ403_31825 [Myxococcus sp. NMCA1]
MLPDDPLFNAAPIDDAKTAPALGNLGRLPMPHGAHHIEVR